MSPQAASRNAATGVLNLQSGLCSQEDWPTDTRSGMSLASNVVRDQETTNKREARYQFRTKYRREVVDSGAQRTATRGKQRGCSYFVT
jgi:hypothetical protein